MIRTLLAGLSLGAILVTQAAAQGPQPPLPCENVLGSITTNLVNEQRAGSIKDQEIARLRAEVAKLQTKPAEVKPPEAPK